MASSHAHFLKFALLLLPYSFFLLCFLSVRVKGLNVGIRATDSAIYVTKECSRKCESEYCSVPPFLRYGKYCGLLYSGCPGEKPCDGLDACCMKHDACIQVNNKNQLPCGWCEAEGYCHDDYLSQKCNQDFLDCMGNFKKAGGRSFKGNKCETDMVIDVISIVIEAALIAGRVLHKP